MWKLDAKLKQFSLVGKVPAPGVVNSLQLLTAPKGFVEETTWAKNKLVRTDGGHAEAMGVGPILVVAGIGQEPKLGRWMKVKDGGAKNCSLVFLFPPRTT